MATHLNQNKDPKGADGGGTAHSNYTAQRIGNDHGNIKFGPVSYTHLTLPTKA